MRSLSKTEFLDHILKDVPKEYQDKIRENAENLELRDSLQDSVMESHSILCEIKGMGVNDAFGNDPAIFYGLALAGECGELANNLIKAMRVGGTKEAKYQAICSEIADVYIYTILLAQTNEIDLEQTVRDKVKIIIERARSGYYGGRIPGRIND